MLFVHDVFAVYSLAIHILSFAFTASALQSTRYLSTKTASVAEEYTPMDMPHHWRN